MQTTNIRRLSLVLATAAVTLSACFGGATPEEANEGNEGGDETAASGDATSGAIDWWGWTPESAVAEEYITAFNAEYPDIEVNFRQIPIDTYEQTIRPALASDTGPDVFDIAPGAQFVLYEGQAAVVEPAVEEALGDDWEEHLAPIGVAGLTNDDGELKAVSIGSTFAGPVWINQALFEQVGVEPPTTVDEWIEVCETFRSNDIGCFIHGASQVAFNQDAIQALADTIQPGLFTAATIGEARWTDPDLVTAFETWGRLFEEGVMQEGALGLQQYPDANNGFMSQQYAMVMMGTWYMQFTRPSNMEPAIEAAGVANPEPFTMVPIPFPAATSDATPGAMFGDSNYGLAVSNSSDNQAAATTFAVWMGTSEAGQQTVADALNDIPALSGVTPTWDEIELVAPDVQQPRLEELMTQAETVTENRLLPNAELADAIGVASTSIAAGDVTAEQAMETLQAAAEASGVEFSE